jgi:CubicO group peptidase (beta-lactamase class C family)
VPVAALDAVAGWPAPGSAVGVVGNIVEGPAETNTGGRGSSPTVLDVRGDPTVVRSWASVTKLLVALAVLVAAEEGTLDLDEPAGPPGSTVRHLLAHASGLGPEAGPPLTAPGRRRIYSNAGYEALAAVLAARAAMPFATYLAEGVLTPLGLTRTELPPTASPAWGARGPLVDLLALATELSSPRLVAPATLAAATTVAFAGLAGVVPGFGAYDPCDWGLGFELRDAKAPHWTGTRNSPATFGHFGRSGSFLWVDPAAGLALAALCGRDFGPWARTAWPTLADAVLTEAGRGAPWPADDTAVGRTGGDRLGSSS